MDQFISVRNNRTELFDKEGVDHCKFIMSQGKYIDDTLYYSKYVPKLYFKTEWSKISLRQ